MESKNLFVLGLFLLLVGGATMVGIVTGVVQVDAMLLYVMALVVVAGGVIMIYTMKKK